jgi:hypothetical protein
MKNIFIIVYSEYYFVKHKNYNYLQSIFNQKLFTKDIKNAEQQGFSLGYLESFNYEGRAQKSGSERTIAN